MNVLEKILNYIDRQKRVCLEIDNGEEFNAGALDMANSIKDFIRKRMDEAKDINVNNADAPYITLTLNEDGVAEGYDDTYDVTIHCESEEEQERVVGILERYPGWIPVEDTEHTPEDEKSYLNYGLFVNAWMPIPKPYRPEDIQEASSCFCNR